MPCRSRQERFDREPLNRPEVLEVDREHRQRLLKCGSRDERIAHL